ncbi:hypothetical protein IX51_11780 [uncultured archaeon]|nr:hypothetical protein IX51_11780 [uncultured archaeon]
MSRKLDIIGITQWAQKGLLLKDFYEIFNIPYPTYEEISKAISHLSELFDNYSWYVESISSDNTRKKIEEQFKLLLADIFGELGISIKLAGEGYIKYSLREIRSVLDLLFAGLFTVSSWVPDSQKNEEGTNPMADAFFSGYWDKMKPLSLDGLVLPILEFGEERKRAISSLRELSDKFYPDIVSKFDFDKDKITTKEEQRLKKLLEKSLNEFFMNLIKDTDEWPDIATKTLGNTEYFYWILMSNDEFTLRACKQHEGNLLEDLKKRFGIKNELTKDLKQELSQLTFIGPEFDKGEGYLCGYSDCENNATIYGIYSRPDTRAMSKLIKLQLQREELEGINSCVVDSFREIQKSAKGSYFGDIIYSEIYSKLNDYVHSNIVEEPTISQWFYDFFVPTIIVLQCILSRPLWMGDQNK